MAGREIEHLLRVFIPNLECGVSRLSGVVLVLLPHVQAQNLLCRLMSLQSTRQKPFNFDLELRYLKQARVAILVCDVVRTA